MVSLGTLGVGEAAMGISAFLQNHSSGEIAILKVGDPAPDFCLRDFNGKTFTLSKRKNRKVVLLWFTNLCEGCQAKLPEMEKLKHEFQKKRVDVVAVSQLGKDRKTGEATSQFSGKYIPGTCPLQNIFLVRKDGTIGYTGHYPGIEASEIKRIVTESLGE